MFSVFSPFGGTGGGGNATVPVDAPIQPPQAFVDAAVEAAAGGLLISDCLANKGITFVSPAYIAVAYGLNTTFSLNGNTIPSSNINELLATAVSLGQEGYSLDLAGGTNAAPTGQGLTDKTALISAGWTVTTN